MVLLNYTALQNATDLIKVTSFVQENTSGFALVGIAMMLFVIFFARMSEFDWESAFAATAVFSAVLVIFLKAMGLIGEISMFVFILLAVGAVLTLAFRKKLGL